MELELRDIAVRRGGRAAPLVLDGVSLRVDAGERIAVMGANGAGKSTLGLVLAGALPVARGSIAGSARDSARAVLQRPEASFLAEHVLDEVALGAVWNGAPAGNARRAAHAALQHVGLDASFEPRDPLTLSGGEQRRVAIAAVLATDPRVVILDEPSAGLDAAARRALLEAIAVLHAGGRSVITITHDADEAARVADRLVVLDSGRIAYDGPIDVVLGDPGRAASFDLVAPAEVQVLHALARRTGASVVPTAHPDRALEQAQLLMDRVPPPGVAAHNASEAASVADQSRRAPAVDPRPGLPPSIDARPRVVATVGVVAAALLASTVVGAAAVAAALVVVLLRSPAARARARVVVRPIISIAVMLIALQFAFGRDVAIELVAGVERTSPLLVALHRVLQIAGVLIASLLLTATTSGQDLGAALRWFLRPLRALRVPVDDLALVIATALSILPTLDAELDRIRMARSARGIRARGRGPLARIRLESLVLMPLLVTSFRRARLLADALVVRGVDPRAEPVVWRPRSVPGADLFGLVSAMILVLVAWRI